MASPNSQSIDPDFARLGIAIVVVIVGLWAIEQVNPKLSTPYLIVVLLGVALTQRAGIERFTAFLLKQTEGA